MKNSLQPIFIKIKGSALIFATFIGFIICFIIGLFFLVAKINNQYVSYYMLKDGLRDNVWSALRLIIEEKNIAPVGSNRKTNLYDDDSEDVHIKRNYWGAYQLLNISISHPKYSYSKNFLLGDDFNRSEPTALYFSDNNQYLSVSGKTLITGDAYLPNAGIRVTSVAGFGFSGKSPITGKLKTSTSKLPDPEPKFIRYLDLINNTHTYNKDYVLSFEQALIKGKIANSFSNHTMYIVSDNAIFIDDGLALEGNIIVKSNKKITINKTSQLSNILLVSPIIDIMDGYLGSNQFFASDSLMVGTDVNIVFPGYIGLYNTKQNPCSLWVGKGSIIEGGIFAYQRRPAKNSPYVLLDYGSHLYGQIYCNGQLEIRSNVTGSVYTNAFYLGGNNAEYDNLLLNIKIDLEALPEEFSGFDVTAKTEKLKLISCLN